MKKEYYEISKFKPFKIVIEIEEERRFLFDMITNALGSFKKDLVPMAKKFYEILTEEK